METKFCSQTKGRKFSVIALGAHVMMELELHRELMAISMLRSISIF